MKKCDTKWNLRQNTVFLAKKFTQALKILHEPGSLGSQHFVTLKTTHLLNLFNAPLKIEDYTTTKIILSPTFR